MTPRQWRRTYRRALEAAEALNAALDSLVQATAGPDGLERPFDNTEHGVFQGLQRARDTAQLVIDLQLAPIVREQAAERVAKRIARARRAAERLGLL